MNGMQGTYRIHAGERELLESFVAAPGPAGWRYFGRVFQPETEEEIGTVDFVVDAEWRLVRYRERRDGEELVVVPGSAGLEVVWAGEAGERAVSVADAEIVWSRSPCSLLVAEHRARSLGTTTFPAVRVDRSAGPERALISLDRMGHEALTANPGSPRTERIVVRENERTFNAVIQGDRPLSADGWFDLVA